VDAPRLRAACGDQREREHRAADSQQFAGRAPVTERRGPQRWGHWRVHGPKFRRPTCLAWAAPSRPHSSGARAFDAPPRATGAAHQAALRALACKGMRIVSRGWHDRTPDDDAPDRAALQRRGSPRRGAGQKASHRA
jgi:hypothetical protein